MGELHISFHTQLMKKTHRSPLGELLQLKNNRNSSEKDDDCAGFWDFRTTLTVILQTTLSGHDPVWLKQAEKCAVSHVKTNQEWLKLAGVHD